MKNQPPTRPDPRSAAVQNRRISYIPAFTPAELRARHDGWTPVRQAEFIGFLAETRCVKQAAAAVGMSRESAYRLRRKRGAEDFAAVWDEILGAPKTQKAKVTLETLLRRVRIGRYRPMMRAGRYVGTQKKADNSALLSAIARLDQLAPSPDEWDQAVLDDANEKGAWL
ncbi:hypothetical protein [Parasphingorhabdus cellanae]|uniref:Helix-turn-helix domain-containing protein n=1 Tax=Parasphingorhabdus cellanae TaxID=2806553 RepID=A0ABX7T1Q3_9SPHN|nr:hypothetical protein [Parasphingorhabdus cellanae]QTD55486.1 hypothetical protein J4G78_14935 [Parasphingorhabdus cellanae]